MKMWVWIWLAVSIVFEVGGDYFVKVASNSSGSKSIPFWLGCLFFYNLMLLAWMVAIHDSKQITIPGTIWLVCGQLALVLLGIGFFGEHVTFQQKVGIGFSVLALVLLSL